MTRLITMHTHSSFCNHATDPLPAMVDAARAAGISAMACTEHYPIPDELDPTKHSTMPAERLPRYIEAVREQQRLHDDIDILLGCELDWLGMPDPRGISAADFEQFDIMLGSVHFVDGVLVNGSRSRAMWEKSDVDAVWLRYIDLWCDAARSDLPFTVMAHPDVVKRLGYRPSFDLEPHYERMAQAAAEGGRMIEVNTSGLYHECAELYPAPGLLRAFRRAGVAATVGTDAHAAKHIARGIGEAYDALRAAGYTRLAVPQRGGTVTFEYL